MFDLMFILALAIVVFIHEFGHYFIAKLMGVKVLEVQVFFFPILTYTPEKDDDTPFDSWRHTKWVLGIIPLGGVTHFLNNPTSSRSIINKAPWQRLLISLAGVSFNLLTAIIVFILVWTLGNIPHFVIEIGYVSFLLAIFNIIPIYPLDGGQALFEIYEMVTGKAPSNEFRRIAGIVGSIFIIIVFWILPLF